MASALLIASVVCFSQPGNAKNSGQIDVKLVTGQIIDKLEPALALNQDQKPQISDAVAEFLKQKTEILPLQNIDPATYASKFNLLSGGMISKFKTILLARQMTTFLGLKPKAADTANVLRHLFY